MERRERKLNRLRNWDYSSDGYYFVTFNVKHWLPVFGQVLHDKMVLNEWGKIAEECWRLIPKYNKYCFVDEFVIMPNHVHGIIRIVKENGAKNSRAAFLRPVHNAGAMVGAAEMRPSSTVNRSKMLLSHAVHSFKSAVTANICKLSESDFQWQRSFYDHIIRDEEELFRVREYIINNPLMWSIDHGKYD